MRNTLRLGRIGGIEIGLNWSWLVVFALIVWSLAVGVFPSQNPGLGGGTYAGMAVIAAILFFASLLLHELGHALVARREGMTIEGITLWLFGGVARFRGMFPSPGAEFRIAIAGPLVSALLGGAFVALAALTHLPTALDGVAAWLGYINFLLLAFNLIPAIPLDGGRVLRSALWKAKGNFVWATSVASEIGRGFGYVMIAAGVVLVFFLGAFSGVWLAFLGWFLLMAAGAESRYVVARESLTDLRVGDLMVRDPIVARPEQTLSEFMEEAGGTARHSTYPVVEDGRVVGLLTLQTVLGLPRRDWDALEVRDCMLPRERIAILTEEESASEAFDELSGAEIQRGPVTQAGRLVGVLSLTDLVRAMDERVRRSGPRPGRGPWPRSTNGRGVPDRRVDRGHKRPRGVP